MLVTTRAMRVTVHGFFFTGIADGGDFNVKGQLLPCQRVIAVNVHVETTDFQDRDLHRAFLGLQV